MSKAKIYGKKSVFIQNGQREKERWLQKQRTPARGNTKSSLCAVEVTRGGRCSGKTLLLIQRAAQTQSTILCHSEESKTRLLSIAAALGYKIPEPRVVRHDGNSDGPTVNLMFFDYGGTSC